MDATSQAQDRGTPVVYGSRGPSTDRFAAVGRGGPYTPHAHGDMAMAEPPIPARYAILLELLRDGPSRASDLVEPTDLTLQGVSYHLKQLASEGLVAIEEEDRRARLTQEGIEALHDHFQGLKAFVDLALSEMLHVEECVALADEPVEEGDEVGLFMVDGRLVARQEASPSSGRVRVPGGAGDLVVVSGLSGVVDLAPGRVDVVRLPRASRLPEASALADLVESTVPGWDVLGLAGLEAEVMAERCGLDEAGEVVRFGTGPAARNAAQVGLDVLVIASQETIRSVLEALEDGAGDPSASASVHVHDLPEA